MKNWIKILTLAGFVSVGLMAHSLVFAADISQLNANGWLNPSCTFQGGYKFSTTPGCGVGTDTGVNGRWAIYISPYAGETIVSISSITLEISNNAGVPFNTVLQTYCTGPGSSGSYSQSTLIPVGVNNVTFNWTSPQMGCNFMGAIFIGDENDYSYYPYGTGPGYFSNMPYSIAGTNSNPNPSYLNFYNWVYGGNNNFIPKFAINGTFAPPITNSITEPTNTNVAYYTPITFGGTCIHNGTNQLSLTFGRTDGSVDNLASPTGTLEGDVYSGTYDIDCTGNTWTKTVGGVSPSVVAAIIVADPGTTSFLDTATYGLYVTADGSAPNFLSFDDVMTHSPEINDFDQWLLDVDADPASVSTSTKVCVNYGYQGSSTPFSQDCSFNFNPLTLGYPNTVQFPKETPLAMGNYFAIGYFDDANSSVTYATTTEWDFSVVYSTSTKPSTTFPNGGTPASTANGNNASGGNAFANPNCNQGNIIVSGICSVAVYLLMPKSSDLTHFNGLFNNIKNKPPFGYFTAAQLAISGLATSTPAVMLAGISLLGVFFSPIRVGFTILIYFLAGLFIFNRLRHFNFQS